MIIEKIDDYRYKIPKQGNMKTDAYVFASERLLKKMKEDKTLQQLMNVASLPSIVNYPSVMPDAHEGYGFPIGGVAAFENIVSPGGVGFDINCGVRLLNTNLNRKDVISKIRELSDRLFKNIPAGEGNIRVSEDELDIVLSIGVKWAYEKGYAYSQDLDKIEEKGSMEGIPEYVSKTAKGRGKNQLGSLGSGNHFLEVQYVEEIYDQELAKIFNIEKDTVMVMIHTGSRGLGHQIASDYIAEIIRKDRSIPEKDLAYTYIDNEIGQRYMGAMKAAVNFAFTNRQILTHLVRETFYDVFKIDNIDLIYDVAHNIAKIEKHKIDGELKEVIVHRKGTTRSFPANHQDIPPIYRNIGQPVLIPGSMGTASYLLIGNSKSMDLSFGSTCHGAGRTMSRTKAKSNYKAENIIKDLLKKSIILKARSEEGIVEEVPDAYKNVDEVVDVVTKNGLSKPIARLIPMIVIKG